MILITFLLLWNHSIVFDNGAWELTEVISKNTTSLFLQYTNKNQKLQIFNTNKVIIKQLRSSMQMMRMHLISGRKTGSQT